jgi:hypothetical protein
MGGRRRGPENCLSINVISPAGARNPHVLGYVWGQVGGVFLYILSILIIYSYTLHIIIIIIIIIYISIEKRRYIGYRAIKLPIA